MSWKQKISPGYPASNDYLIEYRGLGTSDSWKVYKQKKLRSRRSIDFSGKKLETIPANDLEGGGSKLQEFRLYAVTADKKKSDATNPTKTFIGGMFYIFVIFVFEKR